MNAKKRFLSLLLTACLWVGLLPTAALAAAPNGQVIYVGNVNVTSGGYWTTGNDGTVTAFTGEGTPADNFIHYDATNNVLTLHNAVIKKGLDYSESIQGGTYIPGSAIGVFHQNGAAELTIQLEGTNTIAEVSTGIYVLAFSNSTGDASLTITGNGSLDASGSLNGILVQSNGGDATLSIENAKVTATASSSGGGVLVQSKDDSSVSLTVDGGSLTATGSGTYGTGINFSLGSGGSGSGVPKVTVSGNAVVDAKDGGIANNSSSAVQVETGNGNNGGIVWDGKNGTVYGDVTLQEDLEIGEGESLAIGQGASLTVPADKTLTNNGAIKIEGTLTNSGTLFDNGTIEGSVSGNQPTYPSKVTVSFSQNGKQVTSVPYGSTVTITATMEKAETAANALSVDTGKVDFYLGDANDTGIKVDTGTVEFEDGAYTASVDVTIDQNKGFLDAGTFKFTADFGGYAPDSGESGYGLTPNTGSAELTVVESYAIDYEDETITLAEGFSLYAAETGGTAIFASSSESNTTSLTGHIQTTEQTLYLQAPATGEGQLPDRREITIPARPAAPTGLTATAVTCMNGRDGKITGVTTAMEYKAAADTAWTACTGTEIAGLAPGSYQVRLAAAAGTFASAAQTVEVPAHTCTAQGAWQTDDQNHWQNCTSQTCHAKLDLAAHTFAWVTDKPATATEAGSRHEQCTVCGYRKAAQSIPATGSGSSTSSQTGASTATPAPDSTVYYTCPACGYHNWTATDTGYRCDTCGYVESTKQLGGYGNVKGVYTPAAGSAAPAAAAGAIPQTADASQPVLWAGLLGVSGFGLAALCLLRRRRQR